MPSDMGVLIWWRALSAIALVNMAAWGLSASAHARRDYPDPAEKAWWRRQLILSAGFVFGCAFRSFLPRADVQRICLYDSWLSSVLVGRSVATVAELCFMAQMALHLRRLAERNGATFSLALSRLIVPIIVVAETCSWYAVLTTNYLGNSCEESLWATAAALLLLGCAALWPRCDARSRRLLTIPFVAGPGYLLFMAAVDIPMYLTRWQADRAAGRAYLSVSAGLHDLATRWVVTRQWQDWRAEMPWMTLYFSVAVWISLALATPSRASQAEPGA
ncbi:MAG: hypothetical protein ACHQ51_11880 [Elusimicrobiota bacterium]